MEGASEFESIDETARFKEETGNMLVFMLVDSPCEVPWHGTRLPVNVKEGRVNNCFTWYMSRLYREVLFHTRENHFPYQKHDVEILRRLLVYCVYYC